MRSTRQLAELMLQKLNDPTRFRTGLCDLALSMRCKDEISEEEYNTLLALIETRRGTKKGYLYWPKGDFEPRRRFLLRIIDSLPRPDVTLLLILRQALLDGKLYTGLCYLIQDLLSSEEKFSPSEAHRLANILRNHDPREPLNSSAYYFERGEVEPRLEFLNKLIEYYGKQSVASNNP